MSTKSLGIAAGQPVELTPSLRSVALAALAASIPADARRSPEPGLEYLAELPHVPEERAELVLRGGRHAPADEALVTLGAALRLDPVELLAIALLQAADDDARVACALAVLQAPVSGGRPTLGIMASAFARHALGGRSVTERIVGGAALACGVLELLDEELALPERRVALPTPLFLALRGLDGPFPRVTLDAGDGGTSVPLGPSLEAELARRALALGSEDAALCIRSGSLAECRAAARIVARALGRRAAFLDHEVLPAGFGAFALLRDLLPVFTFRLGPGERRRVPVVSGYQGPVLVLSGPEGAVETSQGAAPDFTLGLPAREERALLWASCLGDAELAAKLAIQHRHGPGRIAQLGRLARHFAALDASALPSEAHVQAASWTVEGGGLGSLAQALREPVPDEAFVTSAPTRRELEHLLLRCRHREALAAGLGPSLQARARAGVRALFVGPSGTGKTLAASWLACRLGVPLYRIDLASVTSKYIGETEKNLAEVLARAEQADVALLFDEADSLFGRRTEVRDSHDRFANAQTNYLLQRIESYDGIVLLTSNSRSRFDPAFTRRLDTIIDFPLPGPEERRALWRAHLGAAHSLAPEQLNRLAATADLAGGHIRNAVLSAAVIATAEARAISHADIVQALDSEYHKLGACLPPELSADLEGRSGVVGRRR